jgi:hypothetical protein
LPKIGTKKSKINNKQSPPSDDYPQLVATDDEKAFNNCKFKELIIILKY